MTRLLIALAAASLWSCTSPVGPEPWETLFVCDTTSGVQGSTICADTVGGVGP